MVSLHAEWRATGLAVRVCGQKRHSLPPYDLLLERCQEGFGFCQGQPALFNPLAVLLHDHDVLHGFLAKQAGEQAEVAVLEALAPICVAQFQKDGDRAHKLETLQQAKAWMRGSFVAEQGWATMPGADKPGVGVAVECAIRILAINHA